MRLTKEIKSQIEYQAFLKSFRPREEALCLRDHKLADEAYNAILPAHVRTAIDVLERFEGVKAGWFRRVTVTKYNVGGYTVALAHEKSVVVPHNLYETLGTFALEGKHGKLAQKLRDLANDWETFRREKKQAAYTLQVLMKQTTTTEGLFKLWPEGKKFYATPPLTPTMRISVPAVQMESLNKVLGLTA